MEVWLKSGIEVLPSVYPQLSAHSLPPRAKARRESTGMAEGSAANPLALDDDDEVRVLYEDDDDDDVAPPAKKAKKADDPQPAEEAEELASSSSSQPSSPTVIVFAPGASGSTAKAMRQFQDGLLTSLGLIVSRCDDSALAKGEARWTCQQVGSSGNVRHLLAVVGRAAAAYPGSKIFLAGASFGNRVAAEVLRTHGDELRELGVQPALISCGYPLISPGKPGIGQPGHDAKRPASLLHLPKHVSVLLLQVRGSRASL